MQRGLGAMKIVPNQTFLEGTERFEKGLEYEVDEARAATFAERGWIEGSSGQAEPAGVTLEVHDGQIGHEGEGF